MIARRREPKAIVPTWYNAFHILLGRRKASTSCFFFVQYHFIQGVPINMGIQ